MVGMVETLPRVSFSSPVADPAPDEVPGEWTPPEPLTPAEAAILAAFTRQEVEPQTFYAMLGQVAARALAKRQRSLDELEACGWGHVNISVRLQDGRVTLAAVEVGTTDRT